MTRKEIIFLLLKMNYWRQIMFKRKGSIFMVTRNETINFGSTLRTKKLSIFGILTKMAVGHAEEQSCKVSFQTEWFNGLVMVTQRMRFIAKEKRIIYPVLIISRLVVCLADGTVHTSKTTMLTPWKWCWLLTNKWFAVKVKTKSAFSLSTGNATANTLIS